MCTRTSRYGRSEGRAGEPDVDGPHDRDALVEGHHRALRKSLGQAAGHLVGFVAQAPALVGTAVVVAAVVVLTHH
ncbi:MAG: hypothetical protein ACLP2J_08915 [Acidimicrobiales bacterium]